jgi:hypothetical protein
MNIEADGRTLIARTWPKVLMFSREGRRNNRIAQVLGSQSHGVLWGETAAYRMPVREPECWGTMDRRVKPSCLV